MSYYSPLGKKSDLTQMLEQVKWPPMLAISGGKTKIAVRTMQPSGNTRYVMPANLSRVPNAHIMECREETLE